MFLGCAGSSRGEVAAKVAGRRKAATARHAAFTAVHCSRLCPMASCPDYVKVRCELDITVYRFSVEQHLPHKVGREGWRVRPSERNTAGERKGRREIDAPARVQAMGPRPGRGRLGRGPVSVADDSTI